MCYSGTYVWGWPLLTLHSVPLYEVSTIGLECVGYKRAVVFATFKMAGPVGVLAFVLLKMTVKLQQTIFFKRRKFINLEQRSPIGGPRTIRIQTELMSHADPNTIPKQK